MNLREQILSLSKERGLKIVSNPFRGVALSPESLEEVRQLTFSPVGKKFDFADIKVNDDIITLAKPQGVNVNTITRISAWESKDSRGRGTGEVCTFGLN